jgi:DNA polymerase-1
LSELSLRYLNHESIKLESLIGSGRDQLRMDEVPIARVAEYAAEDADVTLRLTPILSRKLAGAELSQRHSRRCSPAVGVERAVRPAT